MGIGKKKGTINTEERFQNLTLNYKKRRMEKSSVRGANRLFAHFVPVPFSVFCDSLFYSYISSITLSIS